MLSRRALSRAEIAERLERRGFATADVAAELRRLAAAALLDDVALARRVCEDGLMRGQGRRAIAATLRRRKIPRQVASEAVEEIEEGAVWNALQRSFARAAKRYAEWRDDRRERDKLVRSLLARGFDLAAVKRIMARVRTDEDGV